MYLDESIPVFGNWFYIHFIENPGMAFGLQFGGDAGKLLLSTFRIVAICGIAYYLWQLIRNKAHGGFIIATSLVLAGAAGNIIDSAFYGLIFSESPLYTPQTAEFLPEGGGYAGFLHGHVVDMLYFPIIEGYWPEWVPYIGGDFFQFFRPIFNIADSAITVGIFIILFNQKKFFASNQPPEKKANTGEVETTEVRE